MKERKFKTTMKCSGCVAQATPFLNETVGVGQWQADINDPQKLITVTSDADDKDVIAALLKAGYKAEKVS